MADLDTDAVVRGVAQAYGKHLKLSQYGNWDDRPQHVLQRGIEAAMTKWLNDNRADVLATIAQAAQDGAR